MRAVHKAAPDVNPPDENFFHAQIVKANRAANNVNNRIDRANFVEMNFLRRLAVNFALRLRDNLENFQRGTLNRIAQRRIFDYVANVRHGAVLVTVLMVVVMNAVVFVLNRFLRLERVNIVVVKDDVGVGGADTIFHGVGNFQHVFFGQAQLVEFLPQIFFRHAQLYARAQKHVPADSRRAVEVQCFHAAQNNSPSRNFCHYFITKLRQRQNVLDNPRAEML